MKNDVSYALTMYSVVTALNGYFQWKKKTKQKKKQNKKQKQNKTKKNKKKQKKKTRPVARQDSSPGMALVNEMK